MFQEQQAKTLTKQRTCVVVLWTLLVAATIPFAVAQEEYPVPSGVRYQLIGTYSVDRLKQILTSEVRAFSDYDVSYSAARYPVKLYRVTYPSVIPERNDHPTIASGLLAVPESGSDMMPVVSYQHGTVFSKTEVPSHPDESMETRLMVAQFAGQGYIVVAADYFGKGQSAEKDSYLVKLSTQQACLDMLYAAQSVSAELKIKWGPLFLSGWSQGGWATMVFLNRLENLGISVKAAATASAPEDLFAIINRWIHAPQSGDAAYLPALLALQMNAYEDYYGFPGMASSLIKPQYQTVARNLYLNKITWEQASPDLPKHLSEMLDERCVSSSSAGDTRYWQIVQENQAYRWRSKTPLRSYYGDADEVVPPYIANLPVDYQEIMGGAETTGVEVTGKADHRGTFIYAVADEKKWFDDLARQAQ
jgi:pimeloyl-ACP methyl ester carboxylesterase